jgi:putative flippase GtrA
MKQVKDSYQWVRARAQRALQVHFVRFALVGAGGFALSTVLLKILHGDIGMGIFLATLLTCEFGLLWNFVFHENWTYNSVDHHHKSVRRKLLEFHMSSWSGVVILTLLETAAVKIFHFEYLISFVVAGIITMFWNFFWTKYYIFKGSTPDVLAHPEDTVRGEKAFAVQDLVGMPRTPHQLLMRFMLIGTAGCLISFASLSFLAVFLDIRFVISASLSLLVGVCGAALLAVVLVFPKGCTQFIKRNSYTLLAVACCLLFIALGTAATLGGRHISKITGNAITYDELAFLPNGYFHQEKGVYYTNPEHPPLVKDIAALPFHILGAKLPTETFPKDVLFQDYAQYYLGKVFLFESGNDAEQLLFYGRLSVLLANAALLFLLFWSLAMVWSRRAGFIAVFLITMSQFSLAHAAIVTVDFMATAFTLLTLVWFSAWLKSLKDRTSGRLPFLLSALCLSGSLVSKFSTILLVPMLSVLTLAYILVVRKQLEKHWLKILLRYVGLVAVALVFVVIFYSFHVRNMPGQDIVTQLHKSYDTTRLPEFGLRILETIATQLGILGRALAEFAHGLLMINNRIYNGAGGVYFNGTYYGAEGAGLQYFPLLYLTKLQLGYHLLSIAALAGVVWLGWKTRFRGTIQAVARHPLAIALAIYAVLFAGIATLSTLQIGLRHILPAIAALMVLTALGIDHLIAHLQKRPQNRRWLAAGTAFVATWMVGSMVLSFPNYLSYYNILAGGTDNGYKLAVDSNYDWGQDIKRLAKWQQDNHVDKLYTDIFTNPFLPIQYYLGPSSQTFAIHADPLPPPGSYIAVSVHQYQQSVHKDLPPQQQYRQLDKDFVARIGKTIFVYKIPAN